MALIRLDHTKAERFHPLSPHSFEAVSAEIVMTRLQIKDALRRVPADMDHAKLLISKLCGLKICAGEMSVRLKPPIAAIKAQGRASAAALAVLMA